VDDRTVAGYTIHNLQNDDLTLPDLVCMHSVLVNLITEHRIFDHVLFFSAYYGIYADNAIYMYTICAPKDIKKFMRIMEQLGLCHKVTP